MTRITISALHGWAMHSGLFKDLADTMPEADWRGIDLPGHGRGRGKLAPWASLEYSHRLLPQSRLLKIPGAAHAPFLTDAGAVAEAVRGFINDV